MPDLHSSWRRTIVSAAFVGAIAASSAALAQPTSPGASSAGRQAAPHQAIAPLTQGWYDGRVSLYLSTDASDRTVARQTHTNYVPKLANAIAGRATDNIYQLTNFAQGNILPSAPLPAGPENRDPNYTPLWQLTLVTWKPGAQAHLLKSEGEVLDEKARGHVTVAATNVVINCPVVYTPGGGALPGFYFRR